MSMNTIKTVTLGLGLLVGSTAVAQKSDMVNAILEYQKTPRQAAEKDYTSLVKTLLSAEDYIDGVLEHEQTKKGTKDGPKAHYYYGAIYYDLAMYAEMPKLQKEFSAFSNEETLNKAIEALNYAYANGKSRVKEDAENFVLIKAQNLSKDATKSFQDSSYLASFEAFAFAYDLKKRVLEQDDTDTKTNAQVAASNALVQLKKEGDNQKTLRFIKSAYEIFPGDLALASEGVQVALKAGDEENAMQYANSALEANKDNALAYGTFGTVFLSEGKEDKAEQFLIKATELEPTNVDYQYNLGALYIGKGQKLQEGLRDLDLGDPRRAKMEKEVEETYSKAVAPLEVYLSQEPDNLQVVRTLMQVSNFAGDEEKKQMYYERMKELKNK